jgi:tetratricopeptide (TPR) repeat protein
MSDILKEIINHFNNNHLDKALDLCEANNEKKIAYLINNIKGAILFKQQKYELAKNEFLKSIDLDEKFLDPHKNLFNLNIKLKDYESAIINGKNVIKLESTKNPLSYFNLALAYDLNNDFKKAIEFYKIVETSNLKEKKILFNNLAKCFLRNENILEAKNYYQRALEFDQNDKVILNNLLILYLRLDDKDKSEYFYKKAKAVDDNYMEFRLNESEYFFSKNNHQKSIDILRSIIDHTKNYIAYTKLAKIYSMINDKKKAIQTIDEALTLYPDKKDLRLTRGIMHLINGEFEKGWALYEYRNLIEKDIIFQNIKIWKGENLKDSSLLVTCEQGLGDVLQFSKFLINLSSICKKIDFVLYDKLIPIYKKEIKNIKICSKKEIIENNYDYKISLGSLNKYFYKTQNSKSSDLIKFDKNNENKWRSILENKKKKIGLVWSGNFFGPKEPSRSVKLEKFKKLLKLDFNFYSFQNEIWDRDKEFFKNSNIKDYSEKNFSDIIAIIQNLDLVISTDTFFLHLSCICNKETWGLIPLNADWRWYEYYKYNPYKDLKIYKQNDYKNWDNVINDIYNDLINKFNT